MRHLIDFACAAGLCLLAIGAQAAPVSGSDTQASTPTGRSAAGPKVRAHAIAADFDPCADVYLNSGGRVHLAMFTVPDVNTWRLSSAQAGVPAYADIVTYVEYRHSLASAADHTGSMRWSLWAIPANHVIGWPKTNGHRMGGFQLSLIDAQGVTRDFLYNNTQVTLRERVNTVHPPAGSYCMAFVLEMYDSPAACGTADGYCPAYLVVRPPMVTFR